MNPGHSLDLRRRIVACVEMGVSRRAAARRFAVSPSSVIKLMQKWRQTGSLTPARVGGHRRRKLADHAQWLHAVMAAEPDITLSQLQARLGDKGVTVSLQAISNMLRHLGYSFKKARKPLRQSSRRAQRRHKASHRAHTNLR
jgi:transposase